tara:strand:- start:858 stop:1349 length:492 start_codon:yes stop_codon:yes gene_type:complete
MAKNFHELREKRTVYGSIAVDEISVADLTKAVAGSTGTKNIRKAMKVDKLKADLKSMRAKSGTKSNSGKGMAFEDFISEKYKLHHKSFTDAMSAAYKEAERQGYEVSTDDIDSKVASGPRKPSTDKTNTYSLALTKGGKPQKKALQVQVYNMGKSYELNCYIS